MKTDLMFHIHPFPREEAETKQQTEPPHINHTEQLGTRGTAGREPAVRPKSVVALHWEIPFSFPLLANGGSVTIFCLQSKYHDTQML